MNKRKLIKYIKNNFEVINYKNNCFLLKAGSDNSINFTKLVERYRKLVIKYKILIMERGE